MKAKRLKNILEKTDDDLDIFIRNSINPCGNIDDLEQVEMSTYGFFGIDIPCLILNTNSSKEIETNHNGDVMDLIGEDSGFENISDKENKFDDISTIGAIDYITSFVEDMQEKIDNDDKNKMLYGERILFLNKAVDICRKSLCK